MCCSFQIAEGALVLLHTVWSGWTSLSAGCAARCMLMLTLLECLSLGWVCTHAQLMLVRAEIQSRNA